MRATLETVSCGELTAVYRKDSDTGIVELVSWIVDPLRNIARNITQRIGSPNACLLNLVLLYQRAFRLRSSGNITTNRMTATIAVSRSAMACAAITP